MRIGTWNLDGGWSVEHRQVLTDLSCDVWLLTENQPDASPDGYYTHTTSQLMTDGKHWAGIASRWPIFASPDPDVASVRGETGGYRFCTSVLPWPLAGEYSPWGGGSHGTEMGEVVGRLGTTLAQSQIVWGGDWNQPLDGNIQGFTRDAQRVLTTALERFGFAVPTRALRGRNVKQFSIDHIAVRQQWTVISAAAVAVAPHLSDHDAYWVEVEPT